MDSDERRIFVTGTDERYQQLKEKRVTGFYPSKKDFLEWYTAEKQKNHRIVAEATLESRTEEGIVKCYRKLNQQQSLTDCAAGEEGES